MSSGQPNSKRSREFILRPGIIVSYRILLMFRQNLNFERKGLELELASCAQYRSLNFVEGDPSVSIGVTRECVTRVHG